MLYFIQTASIGTWIGVILNSLISLYFLCGVFYVLFKYEHKKRINHPRYKKIMPKIRKIMAVLFLILSLTFLNNSYRIIQGNNQNAVVSTNTP